MPGNGCVPVDVAVIAEPSKLAIHLIDDFLQCPTVQVDTPKAGVVLPVESREQNVLAVPRPQRTFISILWIGSDLAHLLASLHDSSRRLPGLPRDLGKPTLNPDNAAHSKQTCAGVRHPRVRTSMAIRRTRWRPRSRH